MIKHSLRWIAILLGASVLSPPARANTYYPQHPEVQAMVDRAIDYLEKLSEEEILDNRWGGEEYHIVLMAYTHFKARHDLSAKIVQQGLQKAKSLAEQVRRSRRLVIEETDGLSKSNYEVSICILLLTETDAAAHRKDIEALRDGLLATQLPQGGFGYPSEDQGVTSQTQYVVLAIWSMMQNGIPVPPERIGRVQEWLLRVQDVGGAWPYRATDPGPGQGLIAQPKRYMAHSLALAGASSVLITGDCFGIWDAGPDASKSQGILPGMPVAVRRAGKEREVTASASRAGGNRGDIVAAVDRMNQYRREVPYERSGNTWHYYAMYSEERFESFYEMAVEQAEDDQDAWYDRGVEKLKARQHPSGGWGISDRTESPPPVATCFAILFLVRSTQQSIEAATGALAGGQGLPKDTTDIRVDGTQIKGRPVAAAVDDMLDLLEEDGGDLEDKSIPEDLQLAEDPEARRAQLDRLQRLVRGSQSWQARRVAARLLGRSDEMRVVPALIYALSDPDTSVRQYARDGLRFISRKFEGFGLSDDPSAGEVEEAQRKWRQWYLTVNPKYVFLQD